MIAHPLSVAGKNRCLLSMVLTLLCLASGVAPGAGADEAAGPPRVVVLGFGGTIAGKAQGAFKEQYEAGGFCLQGIACNLLREIDQRPNPDVCTLAPEGSLPDAGAGVESSSQCGNRRCMQCRLGSDLCQPGAGCAHSVSCAVQLPAGLQAGASECSCADGSCYCPAQADFCDVERLDSSAMTPVDWARIAQRVQELVRRPEVAGVVVTHGTDTLEETAYFLHLVIDTQKPVVMVGAMRAANHLSADGYMNLMNAIALASSDAAKGKGVLVMLNDTVHGARDVTKQNTTNPATFHSPNNGPLGIVYFGNVSFYQQSLRRHTSQSTFHFERIDPLMFDREGETRKLRQDVQVEVILDFAGNPGTTAAAVVASGVPGLVVAGTGNGSLSPQVKQALCIGQAASETHGETCAAAARLFVARGSRVGSGQVTPDSDDLTLGLLNADTLNPQKARILLMLGLAVTKDLDREPRLNALRRFFAEY